MVVLKAYKAIDYIQYAWKEGYNIDKSKSQIRRDLEQGAVKLNDQKINVDDVFVAKSPKNKEL